MNNKFKVWFETFLEEKKPEYQEWSMEVNGEIHFIDSEFIINLIKNYLPPHEQEAIRKKLILIDFKNGNINNFFKYLAEGYIKINYESTDKAI